MVPITSSLARRLVAGVAGAALMLGGALVAAPASSARPATAPADEVRPPGRTSSPVVRTESGRVRGATTDGVDAFSGIRYAAPPVGARRWRPPAPVTPWRGVADATRHGDRCAALAGGNGPRSESEDCLFVNVRRPAGLSAGDRRPVYVFIHGGGLLDGSSNQADGAAITRSTGAVTVSINYRLGALGFLATPGLTAAQGESGNYGLQDQQAALRWVKRNIARFGGDPDQVTIGGESAGGWSVCTHLVAPGSRGLFAGAMIQSGSCPSATQSTAQATGTAFAARMGCSGADVLACLRRKPAGALIDGWNGTLPAPVRGTRFLPEDPARAVSAGRFARVPVVIGATRDEGRTFAAGTIGQSREQYVAWVRETFGARADGVLARYPWPSDADRFTPAYLVGAIMTDSGLVGGIGGCVNRALTKDFARWTPTWAYEFAHRTGPGLTPSPAGYVWGAGHATELAYLFPSFDNGTPIAPTFDAGERALAARMKLAWGAFTLTGNPNVPGQGWWPRYDRTARVLSLRSGDRTRVISDARLAAQHHCEFWGGS